jgi:hypothetical protein
MAELTEKEFSKHVNTIFTLKAPEAGPIELELIEVKSYLKNPGDADGMERFSIFFKGPAKPYLPQRTYAMSHEAMGDLELFLVPIGSNVQGFSYEAVFNYFK